ncbi:MAG: S8 family peptidase, partial [Mesorhizobium sp.]
LYGAITAEAIARAEVQAPERRRAIAMAVTSASPARGRPTSWSAAIDQLCFEEEQRRLIVLSAGNIGDDLMPAEHLTRNDLEAVDDPSQAWNALTVGAFTEKVDIIDTDFAGYAPSAPVGDLQILTTFYRPELRHFTTLGDTSAATAHAARMAGLILSARPELWPETVRALIVHSAEWTPAMRARIDACNGAK